jgi:hypothetical protein
MPLIDLKTDLTSLKFGSDRPGGGSSRQPFVKGKSLDKRIADDGIETLGRTGGPDMFVRGGFQVASSVADDLVRLGKYFTTVKGGLFVAQQNALSTLGTRIYGGYPLTITSLNAGRLNDGVYTPLSTLAAATGTALGTHPNKQGLDPTGISTTLSRPQYLNLVNGNLEGLQVPALSIKSKTSNRLVNLYNEKITNLLGSTSNELFKYRGGPNAGKGGSLYTVIKASSERTLFRGYDSEISFTAIPPNRRYSTLSQNQIQNYNRIGDSTSTKVQDFRKNLTIKPASNISDSPSYETKNIEQRVGLGDPGERGRNRSNYSQGRTLFGKPDPLDKINSLYLYKSDAVTNDKRKNDLVKFRIATIDNNDPSKAVFAHFRAFINSFTDTMGAEWNNFRYTGRGENFYTYQGFTNTVSMDFTVAVQSIQEQSIAYQKLNYLKSTLAPNYSDNGYMRGNIHRLTVGGYFYETPGIIDNLTYTVPQDSPWEVAIPADNTEINASGGITFRNPAIKELPHIINVSMQFKPIFKFLPETVKHIDAAGAITQRFISLENDGSTNTLYDEFPSNTYRASDHQKSTPDTIPTTPTEADLNAVDAEITRLENLDRG